jgi:hypothetical protein
MRPITNYPGYFITESGRVWSDKTKKFLSPWLDRKGYPAVTLCVDGKSSNKSIHRLVAIEFIPNPNNKPSVNHIDNNPKNTHVTNLEWCTQSENMQHAAKQGRLSSSCRSAKIDESVAMELILRASEPVSDLAKEFNISPEIIRTLFRKETWKHLFIGELENQDLQIKDRDRSVAQKTRGGYVGRKQKLSNEDVEKILKNEDSLTRKELARLFNVDVSYIDHLYCGISRCYVTYKFGITPKRWPKTFPTPEGVDTSGWGFA